VRWKKVLAAIAATKAVDKAGVFCHGRAA